MPLLMDLLHHRARSAVTLMSRKGSGSYTMPRIPHPRHRDIWPISTSTAPTNRWVYIPTRLPRTRFVFPLSSEVKSSLNLATGSLILYIPPLAASSTWLLASPYPTSSGPVTEWSLILRIHQGGYLNVLWEPPTRHGSIICRFPYMIVSPETDPFCTHKLQHMCSRRP